MCIRASTHPSTWLLPHLPCRSLTQLPTRNSGITVLYYRLNVASARALPQFHLPRRSYAHVIAQTIVKACLLPSTYAFILLGVLSLRALTRLDPTPCNCKSASTSKSLPSLSPRRGKSSPWHSRLSTSALHLEDTDVAQTLTNAAFSCRPYYACQLRLILCPQLRSFAVQKLQVALQPVRVDDCSALQMVSPPRARCLEVSDSPTDFLADVSSS